MPGPDSTGPDSPGPDSPGPDSPGPADDDGTGSVPDGPDRRTVAGADAPATTHGDPLLAASEGATEGTEGSRHGVHEAEDD